MPAFARPQVCLLAAALSLSVHGGALCLLLGGHSAGPGLNGLRQQSISIKLGKEPNPAARAGEIAKTVIVAAPESQALVPAQQRPPTPAAAPLPQTQAKKAAAPAPAPAPSQNGPAVEGNAELTGGAASEGVEAAGRATVLGGGSNPPPEYPKLARERGQEGMVLILVRVDAAGRAQGASVARSSGHRLLDEAAMQAVRGWSFRPARRNSADVPGEALVPVEFRLTGSARKK